MISILVVTHGSMARAIIESSEMLVGKSESLHCLALEPGDNIDVFARYVKSQVKALDDGDGVLILVDLLGGSPFNAVGRNMMELHAECLTGLNMSMLLTALDQREYCNLVQLKEVCLEAAASNIVDVRATLSDLEIDDE